MRKNLVLDLWIVSEVEEMAAASSSDTGSEDGLEIGLDEVQRRRCGMK